MVFSFQHLSRLAGIAFLAGALASAAMPSYAFWSLLAKAGKAAGTAGKTGKAAAAAGTATHGAMLAEDAARAGGKAAAADGALVPIVSSVNAALPPEVAMYLSKPAASLTRTDTANMMDLYNSLITKAGKTGDFSAIERLPPANGAKTLAPSATAPARAAPATTMASDLGIHAASHALRLLAHAAASGHRPAQTELQRRCIDPAVRTVLADDGRALCATAQG